MIKILKSAISKINIQLCLIQFVLALIGLFLIDDVRIIAGVLMMIWANNINYKKEDK